MKSDYNKLKIQLASLGTFWMPMLQRALCERFEAHLLSTWSSKYSGPNPDLPQRNVVAMHYALQLYTRVPALQFKHFTYFALVCLFDKILCQILDPKAFDAYVPLSGVALNSGRMFRNLGKPVILECGSTHTDHQHDILMAEHRRLGIQEPFFPDSYRKRVKQEFADADFILLPTRFVAKTFIDRGIPEHKIFVNPYGTDSSLFHVRALDDLDRPFRIICPSGIVIRKGASVLANAWRKLNWKDAELHWIGTLHSANRHLFPSGGPPIHWHSWMPQNELAELYASCDVMVLPSFEEGFARVLVEAAASGLALIATPESGADEFFTADDPEGWLIPSGSVDALCSALQDAKQNRARTRSAGLRAAFKSKNGFTRENYACRAVEIFKTILKL